jgi:hypothetical protein
MENPACSRAFMLVLLTNENSYESGQIIFFSQRGGNNG